MYTFCTYYDGNFAARALAMAESLMRWGPREAVTLHALCLDEAAYQITRSCGVDGMVPVRLSELESYDQHLLAQKATRTKYEYFFTITSCWMHKLLVELPPGEWLTYLDADLFFFSSWLCLYKEMADSSVLVIPHRFAPRLVRHKESGLYNVGWVSFRNDASGRACSTRWREQCLEWCYDRHEGGKFADQKYLDAWPQAFAGVCVSANIGVNVAPWNVEAYRVQRHRGQVTVDGVPLVFYHFQGYRWLTRRLLDPGIAVYGDVCDRSVVVSILLPYARAVQCIARRLVALDGGIEYKGNTRWADRDTLSMKYRVRLVLEGRVFVLLIGRVWYCGSSLLRSLLQMADGYRRGAVRGEMS